MRDAPDDFFLRPLAHRLAVSSFSSDTLSIYRRWFASRGPAFTQRVYRIADVPYAARLGAMRDLSLNEAKTKLAHGHQGVKPKIDIDTEFLLKNSRENRKKILENCIKQNVTTDAFLKTLFPAGFLAARHTGKPEQLKADSADFCENLLAYNLIARYTKSRI
jgi:hypothetical protein